MRPIQERKPTLYSGEVLECPCCRRRMKAGKKRDGLPLMTLDHIIMKSLGGSDDPENLRPMCVNCNSDLPLFGQCIAALAIRIVLARDDDTTRRKWRDSPLLLTAIDPIRTITQRR